MRKSLVGPGVLSVVMAGSAITGCGNSGSVTGGAPTDAGGGADTASPVVDSGSSPDTGAAADSGSGPAHLSLSATKVDFGLNDCGGRAPAAQTLTLTNTGGAPLTWSASIDSLLFFSIAAPTSGTIAPGASAKITVTPSAMPASANAGATTSATIALSTSDTSAGVTFIPVTATANGASFVLTPTTADFGTSPVGVQAPDIALSLLNVGNAAAQVAFGAPSDADFSIVATTPTGTPQSVAPGAAVPGLTARFKASTANPAFTSSALTFTGAVCGAASLAAIPMTGEGASGAVAVSPGTLDFGAVNCGTTAPFAITTLFNSGNASYTWSAALGKAAASPYTVTPSSGTLFAGAQAQIFLTPKPIPGTSAITPNLYGDQVTITTNVPGDTAHVVALDETAQGAILAVTTTPLGYGLLSAFEGSSGQSLVVTNTGNLLANLQLTTGTGSFSATSGTAAASGGTLTSTVTFAPVAIGSVPDSVTISTSTPICQPLPAPVTVSGSAKAADATQVAFAGLGRHRLGSSPTVASGCVLLPGGHVACWGDNSHGQIGNGTFSGGPGGSLAPTPLTVVAGLSGVTSIAAGGDFNCAVHAGQVSCWGNNMSNSGHVTGKLGFGGSEVSLPTVVPGVTSATQVSIGHNMGCALQSGGTIMCWGVNAKGNLGNGGPTGNGQVFSAPVAVSGITTATQIAVGGGGGCALLVDTSVKCWGASDHGQLTTSATSSSPVVIIPAAASTDDAGNDAGTVVATSIKTFGSKASEGVRCALMSDTSVSCWGNQGHGWTGISTANQRASQTAATPIPTLSGATQISVGYGFACAVLQGGTVTCWGRDDFGQLGNGATADTATPVLVTGITNAVQVTAGDSGACALLSTGSVTCWGNNGLTTSPTPETLSGF